MSRDDVTVALTVLRLVAELSQEELAQAAGLRPGTISDYERGKMKPGLPAAQRLLRAMGYGLGALDEAQTLVRRLRSLRFQDDASAPADPGRAAAERLAEQAGQIVTALLRHSLR